MNTIAKCIATFSLFFTLSAIARVGIGTEGGNGGDEYSKDFTQLGLDVWRTLDRMPINGVDNAALLRAVQLTKVSSKPNLTLNGNEVDAINYPDAEAPRIEVSRAGWERMADSPHRRVFLVLHEYLGIMGVDDSQFHVSSQLDSARACPRNPAVRAELERWTKKYCYNITKDDLHFLTYSLSLPFDKDFPATELSQWDFAGLENISHLIFSKFTPITVIRAATFNFLPQLDSVRGMWVDEIEELQPHSKLRSLDFSEHSVTAIADGAFKNLSGLQELNINVDASRVDLARAFDGIAELNKLSIRMQGISSAPQVLLDHARYNQNLRELNIRMDGGDPSNILPGLLDIGFRKISWGDGILMLVR